MGKTRAHRARVGPRVPDVGRSRIQAPRGRAVAFGRLDRVGKGCGCTTSMFERDMWRLVRHAALSPSRVQAEWFGGTSAIRFDTHGSAHATGAQCSRGLAPVWIRRGRRLRSATFSAACSLLRERIATVNRVTIAFVPSLNYWIVLAKSSPSSLFSNTAGAALRSTSRGASAGHDDVALAGQTYIALSGAQAHEQRP